MQVTLSKGSISQLKPVQQIRQQVLKAYCSDVYMYITSIKSLLDRGQYPVFYRSLHLTTAPSQYVEDILFKVLVWILIVQIYALKLLVTDDFRPTIY